MEATEELYLLLPALEQFASDSYVASTIRVAKQKLQTAESLFPQAKAKFEAEPLREKVGQVHNKLDVLSLASTVHSCYSNLCFIYWTEFYQIVAL